MKKISSKGKAIIGVVAFLLITPLVVFYALEETGFFQTLSNAGLELTAEMKKADLDSDGAITISDFSIWLSNWRQYKANKDAYTTMSDLDGDNAVAISDFVLWLQLWREYKHLGDDIVVASTDFGTGKDGNATASGSVNINTDSMVGRGCADGVSYSVTGFDSSKTVSVSGTNVGTCLAAGDEVLIINLSGTKTSTLNVGNYETLIVESISGSKITFTTAKTKFYGDGANDDLNIGDTVLTQRVMLQRIPQYKDVTVSGSISADEWNGKKGGVVFFRATGTVTVTGSITMEGKGYEGGEAALLYTENSGAGEGLFYADDGSGNGGAANDTTTNTHLTVRGTNGLFSGGGGAGGYEAASLIAGTGSLASGSIGGGGGGSARKNGSGEGYAGNGGGGGYGTAGIGGQGGKNEDSYNGVDGSATSSGAGGIGTYNLYGGNYSDYFGGGGGGGSIAGVTNLSKLLFGGGGGGGGAAISDSATESKSKLSFAGTNGGNGGGIIVIGCYNLVISGSGYISAGGADSIAPTEGGTDKGEAGEGGGGAGGSIKLLTGSLSIGSGRVMADGGTTTTGGGAGGSGRVYITYISTYTGASLPDAYPVKVEGD